MDHSAKPADRSSLKWVVFNDPHIDARPPSQKRNDDYEETVFDKLDQILAVAIEHGASALVCTGDWFHRKRPSQVPHRLVKRLIRWLKAVNLPVLTVVGNHDVQYYNTSRRGLKNQPLGSVWEACDNLFILGDREGGLKRVGLYELSHPKGGDVVFVGSNFTRPIDGVDGPEEDSEQFHMKVIDEVIKWDNRRVSETKYVQLLHASVYIKSPPFKPFTLLKDLAKMTTADLVHCGHIHDDIGIFSEDRPDDRPPLLFTNVGSLTRGSLSEDNIQRVPTVVVVGYSSGIFDIRRIPLEYKPAEEIFDVEQYRQQKQRVRRFESWLDELKVEIETSEEDIDVLKSIDQSSLDLSTKGVARRILLSVQS